MAEMRVFLADDASSDEAPRGTPLAGAVSFNRRLTTACETHGSDQSAI
jgi:hypothetical protein